MPPKKIKTKEFAGERMEKEKKILKAYN